MDRAIAAEPNGSNEANRNEDEEDDDDDDNDDDMLDSEGSEGDTDDLDEDEEGESDPAETSQPPRLSNTYIPPPTLPASYVPPPPVRMRPTQRSIGTQFPEIAKSRQRASDKPPDAVEMRVNLAVDAYRTGQYKTIMASAKAFGAPYSRTRSRLAGRHARRENGGANTVLDKDTEAALHTKLKLFVQQGVKIDSTATWRACNEVLKDAAKEGTQPRQVRLRWARRYMARNKDLFRFLKG
ncbi:hypothetical protein F4808DRAFT_433534 [Astrocystis sublimbata]|nr:hypothetical protein F4808DRAFT_433534 [Astrocystis sublimbata]